MVLLVCIPISIAYELEEPKWIGGEIKGEGDLLEGEYEQFAINVKYYEPTILVSSILEEQNVPIYAHLIAIPTIPGMGFPRIQSVSAREHGSNVLSGISYHKPALYSWDDFGYLQVGIRRIEKEADMPDSIDADITARIRYESDVIPGLIGGAEARFFELVDKSKIDLEEDKKTISLDYLIKHRDAYSISSDRGFLVLVGVSGKRATFELYDSQGKAVNRNLIVEEGEEKGPFNLVSGSMMDEDKVRIRVDEVLSPKAVVEAWNDDGTKEEREVVEGDKIGKCKIVKINENSITLKVDNKEANLREGEFWEEDKAVFCDKKSINLGKKQIILQNKAKVTILAGTKVGYTDVSFRLHIPIEKRPIHITPKALARQINSTDRLIEKWDKNIEKLEKIVEDWYKVCLAVTVLTIVVSFFGGWIEGAKERAKLKPVNTAAGIVEEAKNKLDAAEEKKLETSALEAEYGLAKINLEKSVGDVHNLKGNDLELKMRELFPQFYEIGKVDALIEGGVNFYTEGKKISGKISFENGYLYHELDTGESKRLDNTIVYDKDNTPYCFDPIQGSFVPYRSPTKEFNDITSVNVAGEKGLVIPIQNTRDLPTSLRNEMDELRQKHGEVYIVRYKNRLEVYSAKGKEIDAGRKGDMNERDRPLKTYFSGDIHRQFESFELSYIKKISDAQRRGLSSIELAGKTLALGAQKVIVSAAYNCEEAMGKTMCVLLFNACDPVLCPASRCTFGTGAPVVDDVVQSGFLGSILLCWPNVKQGVIPPANICWSGILASMKNIRGMLVQYRDCLKTSLEENKDVGICERIKSIFVCEFVWRQVINLLKIKSGLIGAATSALSGGQDYVGGTKGAVSSTKKAVNYFVKDYAKQIIAAYVGRSTEEIGREVCKSAIAGKLPSLGDIAQEMAKANNPVQFMAHFEEHVYAEAAGSSRYTVFYQIYAGGSKQPVNYVVYLRGDGKRNLQIARGILQTEESADETKDRIGISRYEEICVVINGKAHCEFGKLVSSSWALQEGANWVNKKRLGRLITKADQCIPTYDSIMSASVRRQCAQGKPGENWVDAGICGVEGGDLGICWMEINTRDVNMKEQIYRELCRDGICTRNQICDGEETPIAKTGEVCCIGRCNDKDFVDEVWKLITVPGYKETGLSPKEVLLLNDWYDRIKGTGNIDNHDVLGPKGGLIGDLKREKPDSVYYYMGLKFLYDGEYDYAKKSFEEIDKVKGIDYYTKGILLYAKALKGYDKEKFKDFCKIFIEEKVFSIAQVESVCAIGIPREVREEEVTDEVGEEWKDLYRIYNARQYLGYILRAEKLRKAIGDKVFFTEGDGMYAYFFADSYYYEKKYSLAVEVYTELRNFYGEKGKYYANAGKRIEEIKNFKELSLDLKISEIQEGDVLTLLNGKFVTVTLIKPGETAYEHKLTIFGIIDGKEDTVIMTNNLDTKLRYYVSSAQRSSK